VWSWLNLTYLTASSAQLVSTAISLTLPTVPAMLNALMEDWSNSTSAFLTDTGGRQGRGLDSVTLPSQPGARQCHCLTQ